MIRNLLQIPEPYKGRSLLADSIKPGRNLLRDEQTDGLVYNPRPAHGQRPCAHLIAACHHGGGKEKGVFAMHAQKVNGQIAVFRSRMPSGQSGCHLADPQGEIIMQTRLFTWAFACCARGSIHFPCSPGSILKPNRPEHAGRVKALGTGSCATRPVAKQTSCRLAANVQHGNPSFPRQFVRLRFTNFPQPRSPTNSPSR